MVTLVAAGTGRGDSNVRYNGQSVDDLIIDYMARNNVPGLSLAIVQAPYITRIVGYGLADTTSKQLVASNTVFNIGQITNAFTAVAIMQLQEEKKLTLDMPIADYLKDIPKTWHSITIRNLMTNSSGIPSYSEMPGFDFSKEYTLADIIKLVSTQELLFAPGSKAYYSATNSYLLGSIVEQASGMSYQDYVTKNQIERVGLKNTFFVANKNTITNEITAHTTADASFKHKQFLHNPQLINPIEAATGYTDSDGKSMPNKPVSWSATFASSGILASAQDISLWDISLAGDILIKNATNRDFLYNAIPLHNKHIVPGNAGWFFPGHKGLMEIKGNIPGYSSFLSRFTDSHEQLCVTLLANKGNLHDLDILARKIAGAFDKKLAAPQGSSWSVTMQSPYSVEKTIEHVATIIKAHGGTIFAHINHAQEAKKVNQSLRPTQVLIVGNPAQGTAMMQENPALALDLPLRVMATQDDSGQVWLSFTDPVILAQNYGTSDQKQIQHLKKIYEALLNACQKAISPFQEIF